MKHIAITLNDDLSARLEAVARKSGQPAEEHFLAALIAYVEDAEDIALAERAIEASESGHSRKWSLSEVDALPGL